MEYWMTLSGGGLRACAFATKILANFVEEGRKLGVVVSVSGGGYAAGSFAVHELRAHEHDDIIISKLKEVLIRNILRWVSLGISVGFGKLFLSIIDKISIKENMSKDTRAAIHTTNILTTCISTIFFLGKLFDLSQRL